MIRLLILAVLVVALAACSPAAVDRARALSEVAAAQAAAGDVAGASETAALALETAERLFDKP